MFLIRRGIGVLLAALLAMWPSKNDELAMERAKTTPVPTLPRPMLMNPDAFHAALGLTFTFVWLMVGQIIVGSR
ncbi:hypothetical protein [Crateriforma conspicua]|uniref:Uncharacterized protein n=1 Tax=Crateriforma conspicua TaxID=2527996 RepID=A0A5C5YBD9_9PLAN|nr:hypothetical protein [Crateriforma conspicua]QDV61465.1 hypothetical protein Mal65_05890 [Crateriforma conspicua]TWT72289.1 hypothetical protein Pan14r_46080 [Crateriforma conspicua]